MSSSNKNQPTTINSNASSTLNPSNKRKLDPETNCSDSEIETLDVQSPTRTTLNYPEGSVKHFFHVPEHKINFGDKKRKITHIQNDNNECVKLSIPDKDIKDFYIDLSVDINNDRKTPTKEYIASTTFKFFVEFFVDIRDEKKAAGSIIKHTSVADKIIRSYFNRQRNISHSADVNSSDERDDKFNPIIDEELVDDESRSDDENEESIIGHYFIAMSKSNDTPTDSNSRSKESAQFTETRSTNKNDRKIICLIKGVYNLAVNITMTLQIREHIIQEFASEFKGTSEKDWRSRFDISKYETGTDLPFCERIYYCPTCFGGLIKDLQCCRKANELYIDHIQHCKICNHNMNIRYMCVNNTRTQAYIPYLEFSDEEDLTPDDTYRMYGDNISGIIRDGSININNNNANTNVHNRFKAPKDAPNIKPYDLKIFDFKNISDVVNTEEEINVANYLLSQLPGDMAEQFEVDKVEDNRITLKRKTIGECIICKRQHETYAWNIYIDPKNGRISCDCPRNNPPNKKPNMILKVLRLRELNKSMFSIKTPMYFIKYLWMLLSLEEGHLGRSDVLYMAFNNNLVIANDKDAKTDKMLWNQETKIWESVSYSGLLHKAKDILSESIIKPMANYIQPFAREREMEINVEMEIKNKKREEEIKELKEIGKYNPKNFKDEIKRPGNVYDSMLEDLLTVESDIICKPNNIIDSLKAINGINGAADKLMVEKMDANPDLFAIGDGKVADFTLIVPTLKFTNKIVDLIIDYSTEPMKSAVQRIHDSMPFEINKFGNIMSLISFYSGFNSKLVNATPSFIDNSKDVILNPNKVFIDSKPEMEIKSIINSKDLNRFINSSKLTKEDEEECDSEEYEEFNDECDGEEFVDEEFNNEIKIFFDNLNLKLRHIKIDLRSIIRERRKEDLISFKNEIKFNPNAKDPRWERMLNSIFGVIDNNWSLPKEYKKNKSKRQILEMENKLRAISEIGKQKIKGLQESFGYYLSGHIHLEKSWIWYNFLGRGGKGLLALVLFTIMGEYCTALNPEMFYNNNKPNSEAPSPFYSETNKKRVCIIDEADSKQQLNPLFKTTASGQAKPSRKLHENPTTVKIMCKIIWHLNELFKTTDWVESNWQRFLLLTFPFQFTDKKILDYTTHRPIDESLKDIIKNELIMKQTILNWALEGAVKFYQNGKKINVPEPMEEDMRKYKIAGDSYERWKQSCLDMKKGTRTQAGKLWDSYVKFCTSHKEKVEAAKKTNIKLPYPLSGKLRQDQFWKMLKNNFGDSHKISIMYYNDVSIRKDPLEDTIFI